MVPMVEAGGPANQSLTAWFDVVAAAVAASLSTRARDHFRVAVWADLGDPETFRLLASANLDRNDPKMRLLSKMGTIGGVAWRAKAGEYLCADIKKDRKYKARSNTPRLYVAIFAIRVGEPAQPWGVMTVDAPRGDAFDATDLVIIRRFGKLISAGAAIAIARYSARPGLLSLPLTPAPRRIVVPDGVSMATTEHEESAHDQS